MSERVDIDRIVAEQEPVTAMARALFLSQHPNSEWSAGRARAHWFVMAEAALAHVAATPKADLGEQAKELLDTEVAKQPAEIALLADEVPALVTEATALRAIETALRQPSWDQAIEAEVDEANERISQAMLDNTSCEVEQLGNGLLSSRTLVTCAYNDLRIILGFVDKVRSLSRTPEEE